MIIDDVRFKIFNDIAKKHGIDIKDVTKIVDSYYKTVVNIIEEEKADIKIDYFGKFIYNEAWKAKKEKVFLEFKNFKLQNAPNI